LLPSASGSLALPVAATSASDAVSTGIDGKSQAPLPGPENRRLGG
jgi:hypothetical protein